MGTWLASVSNGSLGALPSVERLDGMSDALLEITGGPSREEIFDSLRLSWENREVSFTVRNTVRGGSERIKGVVRGIADATDFDRQECWYVKLVTLTNEVHGFQYYPIPRRGQELSPNFLVRFSS